VPPGNLLIEAIWPPEINADVDLWVQAPGQKPVGYSNKGGPIFNLLRDDLGTYSDISNINYEHSYSRGLPVGEYTVNLHLFRNGSGVLTIPVQIIVSLRTTASPSTKRIYEKQVVLIREGQELTVVRFKIDAYGALVPGSLHDLPKPLRDAVK